MNEREKFNIISKPEDEAYAQGFLTGAREVALELMEDELPKTEGEISFIQKVNQLLAIETESLNIEQLPIIDINQIHFFKPKIYQEFSSDNYSVGRFNPLDSRIIIARFKKRSFVFKTIVHEMIHYFSYSKFVKPEDQMLVASRSGYRSAKPGKYLHLHFGFFNELVTEKITEDFLNKYNDVLQKEFKINFEERNASNLVKILDSLLKLLAQKSGETEEDIWKKIKKGYFSGEMMHLRLIDRYLGRGALRFLASIDLKESLSKDDGSKMAEFFLTNDQKKRDEIAREFLDELEYLRYKQQAQKNHE